MRCSRAAALKLCNSALQTTSSASLMLGTFPSRGRLGCGRRFGSRPYETDSPYDIIAYHSKEKQYESMAYERRGK